MSLAPSAPLIVFGAIPAKAGIQFLKVEDISTDFENIFFRYDVLLNKSEFP